MGDLVTPLKLYHRTPIGNLESIMSLGFEDQVGTYLTANDHVGIWVSNDPLGGNQEIEQGVTLEIELPADEVSSYEWIDEQHWTPRHREFLVPASLLNSYGPPRVMGQDELDTLASAPPRRAASPRIRASDK